MKYLNPAGTECITFTQANIIYNSRLSWRELVFWLRAFFDSVYFGIGDSLEVFRQLYSTPNNYAFTLRFILGRNTAGKYASFFNQYVINVRELVRATEDGDAENINARIANFSRIIENQAEFLAETFPTLEKNIIIELLTDFTILLIEEINSYILLDYASQLEIFDRLLTQTDNIADYLSFGIINLITAAPNPQVPVNRKSSNVCITFDEFNLIMKSALFWVNLILWFREYRISVMANLGNQEELFNRLIQTTEDYRNALKGFFDDEVIESEMNLVLEYIELINELLNARLAGDVERMNQIFLKTIDNIQKRGAFLNANIPLDDGGDWTDQLIRLNTNLINMSTQFLTGNYAGSIEIFNGLINQAEDIGSALTEALVDMYIQSIQNPQPNGGGP